MEKTSNTRQVSISVVVSNKLGIHARPASAFTKLATQFKSEIMVEKDGEQVNGKSILGLMMLAAGFKTKLKIIAKGPDAEESIHALQQLFKNKFGEE